MSETAPSSRPRRLVLALLALVLIGVFVGVNVATWRVKLRYPGEEHFSEGMNLAEAVRLRQGVRIYQRPTTRGLQGLAYDAAMYGPIYYLAAAEVVDPQKPAYLPLRLVSLLATFGCAAGCALLAFWLSRSRLGAALAFLAFLSYGAVASFGVSARCDIMAVFLSFAGFLVSYRFRDSKAILLAVPLMLLGLFYKQQFFAGPLAVLIFLGLEKRYRRAAQFFGSLALGGLALVGLFQFGIFRGQAFLIHFLPRHGLPAAWIPFQRGAVYFGLALLVPLFLALEFLRSYPNKLLGCYLGCAVFLGLATVARAGSDVNYFLESVLLLSVLPVALFAKRLAESRAPGEVLFLIILTFIMGVFGRRPAPSAADFVRDREVQDYLRRNFSPGTQALGLYVGDAVRAGLDAPIPDLYQYAWLLRGGAVSDRGLVAALDQRQFGVVILNFDLEHEQDPVRLEHYLTAPVRQAILADYRLATRLEMPAPEKTYPNDQFYAWAPAPTATP
jgi:hypothetical protein